MPEKKTIKIGNLSFRNPVITASGTFGMGDVFEDFLDYSRLGGITFKTVTPAPRKGNPPPRILETPCGMLNSIGLENEGREAVLRQLEENNALKKYPTNVIFSVAGDAPEDFASMARSFAAVEGVAMLELNLSCPNVHAGGATFDSSADSVRAIVQGTRRAITRPFTVKLSPACDLAGNSRLAQECGADAVTISNTFLGTAFDLLKKDFVFKNKVAGYSGPAVKPMALYNVYRAAQAVAIPVIASGGISSGDDALEFILAGAKLVSVGTMNFVEPGIAMEIADRLEKEGW